MSFLDKKEGNTNRIGWIDSIRGLGMLLVIIGHIFTLLFRPVNLYWFLFALLVPVLKFIYTKNESVWMD